MHQQNCRGILADDLTGAMDAGVQLAKQGITVRVALSPVSLGPLIEGSDAVVVNTESRNLKADAARTAVRDAADQLAACGCPILYKKIDSTMRGHIGAEIETLLSLDDKPIVVAPALPFLGRITRDGVHYVDGIPLADTEFANDPFAPVPHSRITDIIGMQYGGSVLSIPLSCVRQGVTPLGDAIGRAVSKCRVIALDAETEEDLAIIAEAAEGMILCGSAGLLGAYSARMSAPRSFRTHAPIARFAVLSGSPAAMSKAQIAAAASALPDIPFFSHPVARLEDELLHLHFMAITDALRKGESILVDAAGSSKADVHAKAGGDTVKLSAESGKLQSTLQAVAWAAVKAGSQALVLFGGDTAIAVTRALGASGIEIDCEIEPYMPYGRLIGGEFDGLPVVTKAGAFGSEGSLVAIIDRLTHGF